MELNESELLRGKCRFDFEGHEFIPAGETGSFSDLCWLSASPAVMQKLASLLGLDYFALEFAGWIEIEFYGHFNPIRGHYGHLGGCSREATIHDVIQANILTPDVMANRTPMSISDSLRNHRKGKTRL